MRYVFSKLKQSVTHALPDRMGRKNHGRFCPVISSIAFGSPCMMSVMLENIQTRYHGDQYHFAVLMTLNQIV